MTPTHSDDAGFAAPEIRREIDIDLPADDLWALVSTPAGWQNWLVDEATLDRTTGRGIVVDDGRTREVVIDTVVDGDYLTFTWWDTDHETDASQVRIAVDQRPDGRHYLTIVERPTGLRMRDGDDLAAVRTTVMSASISVAATRWEVRALLLWTCSVRCAARM